MLFNDEVFFLMVKGTNNLNSYLMYVILLFILVPILLHIQNLLYGVSQGSILGPVTFLDHKKSY